MRTAPAELSEEARNALRRENRIAIWRSLAISLGFALPASFAFIRHSPFLLTWLGFGLPMGLAMPWLHIHVLERLRHRSFLVTILRQSLMYCATLFLCLSFSLWIVLGLSFLLQGGSWNVANVKWAEIALSPLFIAALPLGLLLVVPIRFWFALNQKLGPGTLRKWMLGHYHEPREEERIFMFLDMKDSTTLAEQLGNLKFSALVRDFFEDMTLPVLQTKAEASHYIGDEAVITWTMDRGIDRANCLRLFFEFERAIARRAPYYQTHYGLVPGFKAGLHFGRVIATEVGEIKSEIVYHGDVLNTAARIQGLCNQTERSLLLSESLARLLPASDSWSIENLGPFELKGKAQEVVIVAVEPVTSPAGRTKSEASPSPSARA